MSMVRQVVIILLLASPVILFKNASPPSSQFLLPMLDTSQAVITMTTWIQMREHPTKTKFFFSQKDDDSHGFALYGQALEFLPSTSNCNFSCSFESWCLVSYENKVDTHYLYEYDSQKCNVARTSQPTQPLVIASWTTPEKSAFYMKMKGIRIWYATKTSLGTMDFDGFQGVQPKYYFQLSSPLIINLGTQENTPFFMPNFLVNPYPTQSLYLQTLQMTKTQGTYHRPEVLRLAQDDDEIYLPYYSPQETMSVSIETWIFLTSVSGWTGGSFSRDMGPVAYWTNILALTVNSSNRLICCLAPTGSSCQKDFNVAFSRNTWTHLACTVNHSTRHLRGFIDGSHIGSHTHGSSLGSQTNQRIRIGGDSGTFRRYLVGYLFEMRFWTRARSDLEIRQNYKRKLTGREQPHLLYYFPLNDLTNRGIIDHSINSLVMRTSGQYTNISTHTISSEVFYDITLDLCKQQQPFSSWCGEYKSWILKFDYTITPYIRLTSNSVVQNGAPPVTYDVWCYAISYLGNPDTYLFYSFGALKFTQEGIGTFFVVNDKDYITMTQAITIQKWTHLSIIFKYNGSNGEAKIYQDGWEKYTVSTTRSSSQSGKNYLYIGHKTASASTDGWNGYIQHFRIWNQYKVASPREYLFDFPQSDAPNLIADFPLGYEVNSKLIDRSNNNLSISTGGGTKYTSLFEGQFFCQQGTWFDGDKCNDSGNFWLTRFAESMTSSFSYSSETLEYLPSEATISFWFYVDSSKLTSSTYVIIDDTAGGYLFFFQWENSYSGIRTDLCNRTGQARSLGNSAVQNKWSHLAMVGNSPYSFYLDGVNRALSNIAGSFSCRSDFLFQFAEVIGVSFKEMAYFGKILNPSQILYLSGHNSAWGIDNLIFYTKLDDADMMIQNKITEYGRYFRPTGNWPIWTAAKERLRICEGREGRLTTYNSQLGQCRNKYLGHLCKTCKNDITIASVTPSALQTAIQTSITSPDFLVGIWLYFQEQIPKDGEFKYIFSIINSSNDRVLSLRVGTRFMISFQNSAGAIPSPIYSIDNVRVQKYSSNKWFHIYFGARYSSTLLYLNGVRVAMTDNTQNLKQSAMNRDLTALKTNPSIIRFGDATNAYGGLIEDVVWITNKYSMTQLLDIMFNFNINYLSPVTFYYPITPGYQQGIPLLSNTHQAYFSPYDTITWYDIDSFTAVMFQNFNPLPAYLSNNQQLITTLPTMANTANCAFAFSAWVFLQNQTSSGELILSHNNISYLTTKMSGNQLSLNYNSSQKQETRSIYTTTALNNWALLLVYRHSSNSIDYMFANSVRGSITLTSTCTTDHHGGVNKIIAVGIKDFGIHSTRYWYKPNETVLSFQSFIHKSRKQIPKKMLQSDLSMIVYEQNYFDASNGSTCYVMDVADRNQSASTNNAMKRYNENFFTFKSSCICKSGNSNPFKLSPALKQHLNLKTNPLCKRDEIFTGSKCRRDKYMYIEANTIKPQKFYLEAISPNNFSYQGWFYLHSKNLSINYQAYFSIYFQSSKRLEAGFGSTSQYESLNLIHYGTTQYVDAYNPEIKKWTHLAVSCVVDANKHRCKFYVNGVEVKEILATGKYGNFQDLWVCGTKRTWDNTTECSSRENRIWNKAISAADITKFMHTRPDYDTTRYQLYIYLYLDGSDFVENDRWVVDKARLKHQKRHKVSQISYQPTNGSTSWPARWFLAEEKGGVSELLICDQLSVYDKDMQVCHQVGGVSLNNTQRNSTQTYLHISSNDLQVPLKQLTSAQHTALNNQQIWTVQFFIRLISIDRSNSANAAEVLLEKIGGATSGMRMTINQSTGSLLYKYEITKDSSANIELGKCYQETWQHVSIASNSVLGKTQIILDDGSVKIIDSNRDLLSTSATSLIFASSGATHENMIGELRIWGEYVSPNELKVRASRDVLIDKQYNSKLLHYYPLTSRQIGDFKSILSNKASFTSYATHFTSWRAAPQLKASSQNNSMYQDDGGYSPIKRYYLQVKRRDTLIIDNVKEISSIVKQITQGFGITVFLRVSESSVRASNVAQIKEIFTLGIDSSLHAQFKFGGKTAATASGVITSNNWMIVGGFYDRNQGKVFAKLGNQIGEVAIAKEIDFLQSYSTKTRSIIIGSDLQFDIRSVIFWKDPYLSRIYTPYTHQVSQNYASIAHKLFNAFELQPTFSATRFLLIDKLTNTTQIISKDRYIHFTNELNCEYLISNSTPYPSTSLTSIQSKSFCRSIPRSFHVQTSRSLPLTLDQSSTITLSVNKLSIDFSLKLDQNISSDSLLLTICTLILFNIKSGYALDLNSQTATSNNVIANSGSWYHIILTRDLTYQGIYVNDSEVSRLVNAGVDVNGQGLNLIIHDNIKYYLANIRIYPDVSILRAKESKNRRKVSTSQALAYYPLDQQRGNFVNNLVNGKQHTMTLATQWSKSVQNQICTNYGEITNDDDSGKCVDGMTLAIRHQTSHNAIDLSVNNAYDFTTKDGVTFGIWVAFMKDQSTTCPKDVDCTLFNVQGLLKLSIKAKYDAESDEVMTSGVDMKFVPLAQTGYEVALITDNWYYVVVGISKSKKYTYEVINSVISKAYTGLNESDFPSTGTTALQIGSASNSADFTFRRIVLFNQYRAHSEMIQEARNDWINTMFDSVTNTVKDQLLFYSNGQRKVSYSKDATSQVTTSLSINTSAPTVPTLCDGKLKYIQESNSCYNIGNKKRIVVKQAKIALAGGNVQKYTLVFWAHIPSTVSTESGLPNNTNSLLNVGLHTNGGEIMMKAQHLQVIARGKQFYLDSNVARAGQWVYLKLAGNYLRRFEFLIRENDGTIKQARGQITQAWEKSISHIFIWNRGQVFMANLMFWNFMIPNAIVRDNYHHLLSFWQPLHYYKMTTGYGGNKLQDSANTTHPTTLGLSSGSYYWIFDIISAYPDLSATTGLNCSATGSYWDSSTSTCLTINPTCPSGTTVNSSSKICLNILCYYSPSPSFSEVNSYCQRQTTLSLTITPAPDTQTSNNNYQLIMSVTSPDTTLSQSSSQTWSTPQIFVTSSDLKLSIKGDLSSYKIDFSFTPVKITRVQNSQAIIPLNLLIKNTLQGDEQLSVSLNTDQILSTIHHFKSSEVAKTKLKKQDNPQFVDNQSVWENIFTIISYVLISLIVLSLIAELCKQRLISNLWSCVLTLQLYYMLIFTQVPLNKHAENFLRPMSVMMGEFLNKFPQILDQSKDQNDHAFNERFFDMGVKSVNIIELFGRKAVFLLIFFVVALISLPFICICQARGQVKSERVCRILWVEWMTRIIVVLYLDICFTTFIGTKYSGGGTAKFVEYVSLGAIPVILVLFIIMIAKSLKKFNNLEQSQGYLESSFLLTDLNLFQKRERQLKSQYYTIFLLRRVGVAASIVFLNNEPFWCFGGLILSSMIMIAYFLRSFPFKRKLRLVFDLIDEVVFIIICGILGIIVKTDLTKDSRFVFNIGVLIISAVLTTIGLRLLLALFEIFDIFSKKKKPENQGMPNTSMIVSPQRFTSQLSISQVNLQPEIQPVFESPSNNTMKEETDAFRRQDTPKSFINQFKGLMDISKQQKIKARKQ